MKSDSGQWHPGPVERRALVLLVRGRISEAQNPTVLSSAYAGLTNGTLSFTACRNPAQGSLSTK